MLVAAGGATVNVYGEMLPNCDPVTKTALTIV